MNTHVYLEYIDFFGILRGVSACARAPGNYGPGLKMMEP